MIIKSVVYKVYKKLSWKQMAEHNKRSRQWNVDIHFMLIITSNAASPAGHGRRIAILMQGTRNLLTSTASSPTAALPCPADYPAFSCPFYGLYHVYNNCLFGDKARRCKLLKLEELKHDITFDMEAISVCRAQAIVRRS